MQTYWQRFFVLSFLLGGCGGSGGGGVLAPPVNPPAPPPPPPPPPASIAVEPAFAQLSGFSSPVLMLQAPGDNTRWFVVEQQGMVRVFDNDPNVGTAQDYLDIIGRVDSGPNEAGLLGFAFHPDFANNNFVYVSYTAPSPFRSVLSRFTVVNNNVDVGTEMVIYEVPQPQGNHNGGHIAFGADGYLYWGLGDGGGGGDPDENGQDTTNVLGAFVRLDVDSATPYAVPGDNPFAGNTMCTDGFGQMSCPEIYAYGLRNPWRFSFDQQTGELWVGDVGQGDWEEVNRVELGMNYGWDEREGAHCFEPSSGCSLMNVDPITEYDHTVGVSITGGYVYRGSAVPALQDQYLFGDFASGRIWSVATTAPQGTTPTELLDTNLAIASFGQGNDGEVYVVDYGGVLQRIVAP